MALRPCNAANEMGKRVTFGLITGGTDDGEGNEGGDGILIYTKGVISVFFQGVAFDSAGAMVWPGFSAPLIDPADPDNDLSVRGMHFWAKSAITFPLSRKSKGEILVFICHDAKMVLLMLSIVFTAMQCQAQTSISLKSD